MIFLDKNVVFYVMKLVDLHNTFFSDMMMRFRQVKYETNTLLEQSENSILPGKVG